MSQTEQRCPYCGEVLPPELGQHALTLPSGLVTCPHCGAEVTLERPATTDEPPGAADGGARETATEGEETFAGHETVEGVMDEVRDKEEQ